VQLVSTLGSVVGLFGGGEISSRARFATPADFPRQDCGPYSHVHVRHESLGFVHRSRAIFCPRAKPQLLLRFAFLASLYGFGDTHKPTALQFSFSRNARAALCVSPSSAHAQCTRTVGTNHCMNRSFFLPVWATVTPRGVV
jgi:hypothetical protein